MKLENWEIAFSLEMQSSHIWDLHSGHYNRQSADGSCTLELPVGFFDMRSSDLIAFISNKQVAQNHWFTVWGKTC